MSIGEKRGYICVDAYNPSIDLWTTTKNPQSIKIKKTTNKLYVMCMMYLSEFNFYLHLWDGWKM